MNTQLSEAFKGFLAAANNLNDTWKDSEHIGLFSRLYPFQYSFDEMMPLINLWVNNAVAVLTPSYKNENYHCYSLITDKEKISEIYGIGEEDELFEIYADRAMWVLFNKKTSLYIRMHESGKFSTVAGRTSAYGTLEECEQLLKTEL